MFSFRKLVEIWRKKMWRRRNTAYEELANLRPLLFLAAGGWRLLRWEVPHPRHKDMENAKVGSLVCVCRDPAHRR
jgi:hypothetical protein